MILTASARIPVCAAAASMILTLSCSLSACEKGARSVENGLSRLDIQACVGCGACVGHCPQSIKIPAFMKEMAKMMAPGK